MTVSILVVDDEPDVADLFHQRFRREARDGTYVMLFASSGEQALERLDRKIEPTLIVTCPEWTDCNYSIGSSGFAATCRSRW
jgi:CheY-like chemotaxis protein